MIVNKMKSIAATGLMLTSLALPTAVQAQDISKDLPKEKVETIIRSYLLENPEVIIEAIQIMQEKQRMAKLLPVLHKYDDYLVKEKNAPEIGNPNGDVTLVEFFDYRCGYCKRHYPEIKRLVAEDKNLRIVFKQYPILDYNGQNQISRKAAYGALAAQKQGKFFAYHDAMMTMQGSLTESRITEVAEKIGLDMTAFHKDLNSPLMEKRIMNSLVIGSELELTGTPSYVVGNRILTGALGIDKMKEAIAKARKAKKS